MKCIYPLWDDKMNYILPSNNTYDLVSSFKTLKEIYDKFPEITPKPKEYKTCPRCGLKPKLWIFDDGKMAGCGCHHRYFGDCPEAIDINSYYKTHGNLTGYDIDQRDLLRSWNYYTERMKDLLEFKQKDKRK